VNQRRDLFGVNGFFAHAPGFITIKPIVSNHLLVFIKDMCGQPGKPIQSMKCLGRCYQGMMIAIDQKHWSIFQKMPQPKLLKVLKELAGKVKLSAYKKHPRGPKKPRAKRTKLKNKNHVSNAKIIKDRKK
jgi:hypothetical protein